MVVCSNGSDLRYRWSIRLTLVAFIVTLIAGWILWHSVATSSISEVQRRVDSIDPIVTGIRLSLIVLLAVCWPFLARILDSGIQRTPSELASLELLRWRVVIWLIVIELVLGQNLPGQFLTLMQGDPA